MRNIALSHNSPCPCLPPDVFLSQMKPIKLQSFKLITDDDTLEFSVIARSQSNFVCFLRRLYLAFWQFDLCGCLQRWEFKLRHAGGSIHGSFNHIQVRNMICLSIWWNVTQMHFLLRVCLSENGCKKKIQAYSTNLTLLLFNKSW